MAYGHLKLFQDWQLDFGLYAEFECMLSNSAFLPCEGLESGTWALQIELDLF